uniref:CapG n=1 Tax=Capnodium sp. TTI-000886 TaxID=3078996 RepID=A0AA96MH87_9PEZI|nr:CapG [Capnodium sp. TTI-000886]
MANPEIAPHLQFAQSNVANNTGMDALMEDVQKRGLQEENERLRDMHKTYTAAAGGKLTLAPIDFKKPGLRILDSATADGTWLQDVRKEAGDAANTQTYIGTDLVPELFPDQRPAGIEFVKQSITEPWPKEWHEFFDMVHQRQVLGFCGEFPIKQAVANLCALAKPGGWVELVELDVDQSVLGEATVAREFFRLLEQIWNLKGMGGNFGRNLKEWMEEAGLEDVEQSLLRSKVGAKAEPGMEDISINGSVGAGPMIVAMARTLPGLEGFTSEQLDTLPERAIKELKEKGAEFHSFAVRGRVPAGGLKPKN